MAGGPLSPSSVYLGGGGSNLFPNFYTGSGGNASSHDEGIGVAASLGSTVTAELRFIMPPQLPTGQLKLMVRAVSSATTGTFKFTVSDGACGTGTSPSAIALTSEIQSSATILASDQYLDTKVTITTLPAINQSLIVALTFNSTGGWTLAAPLTCLTWVLWE